MRGIVPAARGGALGRALAARAEEAAAILRHQGPAVLLWRAVVKALSPLGTVRLARLCEMDLRQPVAEVAARVELEIVEAGVADADGIVALMLEEAGPAQPWQRLLALDQVLQDLRGGALCFVARHGPHWVHCNWVHFPGGRPVQVVPGRYLAMAPDEAYLTDGFTPPAWRGRGIHAAVNARMLAVLRSRGYRKAYTQLNRENLLSWRGLARVGWKPTGLLLTYTGPGGRVWAWRLSGRADPWLGPMPPPAGPRR